MMGRIRSIKPEFPQSESIGRLSRDARLLFVQLWTLVDDDGRARAASRLLASLLYPYDDDAPALVDGWLAELEANEHIVRYQHEGSLYLAVLNWKKHQKIDRQTASKLPSPPEHSRALDEPSTSPRESRAHVGPRIVDQDLDLGTTSVASQPADAPPNESEPSEPAAPADLHAYRSEAASIVKRVYWLGDATPAVLLRKEPGWDMGRELSVWNRLVDEHDGEFTAAEINAGLEVVREIQDWAQGGPDPPLSLRVFYVQGRRDRLRLCVQRGQEKAAEQERAARNGVVSIADIMKGATSGNDNRKPVEQERRSRSTRGHAHRSGSTRQRVRAPPS